MLTDIRMNLGSTDPGLHDVIVIVGGRRRLARLLALSHQAVHQWNRIPADRVVKVEQLTGISRQRLRPDLFNEPVSTPSDQPPHPLIVDSVTKLCRLATQEDIQRFERISLKYERLCARLKETVAVMIDDLPA